MTTTHPDKAGAKPRQRARKADRRGPKSEQRASSVADQINQDQLADTAQDQAADTAAPIEGPAANTAAAALNGAAAATLSGEVLPPQIRQSSAALPANVTAFQAVGQAYADYARKSWLAGCSLVERFMMTRSLEEAIEVQGDFTKQAYSNLVVHSQKIGELYGEFTRQFFRPLENLATEWRRIGR
jgi:hypothetical protein